MTLEIIADSSHNQQPSAENLRDRVTALVGGVVRHYAGARIDRDRKDNPRTWTNPADNKREITQTFFADGAQRDVVTAYDRPVRDRRKTETRKDTTIQAPGIVDDSGRRVVFVDIEFPSGSRGRELRFHPGEGQEATAYRVNTQGQLCEMVGQSAYLLTEGTPSFDEATRLLGQAELAWSMWVERHAGQSPGAVAPTSVAAVGDIATGFRRP